MTTRHGKDMMKEFEDAAYACDGKADSRFEQLLDGLTARYSALEVAALSSFFLNRCMIDRAHFLAWLAWEIWAGERDVTDVVKLWRGGKDWGHDLTRAWGFRREWRAAAAEERPA
jgi:hypothetical protein